MKRAGAARLGPFLVLVSAQIHREKRDVMGACSCGYTRDEEKNCDGTHKVVKAVKAELAEKLEANGFPHASEYVKNN
jgi:CDGSH-type Zn-finger protein